MSYLDHSFSRILPLTSTVRSKVPKDAAKPKKVSRKMLGRHRRVRPGLKAQMFQKRQREFGRTVTCRSRTDTQSARRGETLARYACLARKENAHDQYLGIPSCERLLLCSLLIFRLAYNPTFTGGETYGKGLPLFLPSCFSRCDGSRRELSSILSIRWPRVRTRVNT